jgi:hypothetical protein
LIMLFTRPSGPHDKALSCRVLMWRAVERTREGVIFMADEAKKEFMEPELTKSEKPLDEVTMQPYDAEFD